jgi:DUF4097 and DUF4098 domain-containing protein YvlB
MKTLLTLILLATAANASAERIDKTINVEPDGEVRIEVIEGKVVVEGWDKSEVRVEGDIPNAKEFVFKNSGRVTSIEVESEHGFWGGKGDGYAKLTVYAPRNSSVNMEGASSSFLITGMNGNVDASSMSGDISLKGGRGKVELESVSGDIDVIDATGKVSLSSVSGDVSAKASAEYFEAQSVSGDIEASIGQSNHVELASVSGDIDLVFEMTNGGELDADTVSGNIDIRFLNKDLDAKFEIETGPGGDVRNRITDDKSTSFMSFSGSLEFTVGKGSGSVDLETMSGTIDISR